MSPDESPEGDDGETRLLRRLRASASEADEALLELFERHRKRWIARLRKLDAPLEQAENHLQEAFVKARLARLTFRGESKVATWIFQIARNNWMDELGRGKHETRLTRDDDEDEDPLQQVMDKVATAPSAEDTFELRRLRECLMKHYPKFVRDHPERAEDLEWIVTEGYRDRELADLRCVTHEAMRKRLQRTRELLREYLQPCAGYFNGRLL